MKFDVAIIGGGLTGCAAAYYLSKRGARVVLHEAEDINAGASGRNAGSLHFQIEHRHIAADGRLSAHLEHIVSLSRTAIAQWQQLETELDAPLELAMHGGIMVADTAEQMQLLERKADLQNRLGLETILLDSVALRARAPYLSPTLVGGAWCSQEGHCNPRLLTFAFARRAQALGAQFRVASRVTELVRSGIGWRLGSQVGSIEARLVLIAAGGATAGVAALARYHLPIFPVGLLITVTERVRPRVAHLVQHVGRRISLKQVEDGNVMIGGGWAVRLHSDALASQPTLAAVAGNLRAAVDLVPSLSPINVLRSWSGVAAVTSDNLPLLGEIAPGTDLFVAGGGSGFTYGPTYARLVSELMLTGGTKETSLDPYSPSRFHHINMFMG